MKRTFFICFSLLAFLCCSNNKGIDIDWKDEIHGDFSFTQQWSYPEGIYHNEYGQLICDGICDPALDNMRDEKGRIIEDSLARYYQLVDTTHLYHTFSGKAEVYEWAGTDFAYANHADNDTVKCYTVCNVATHSGLLLSIIGNRCIPQIELNSITPSGVQYFQHTGGYIKIDRQLWKENILKAEFDFTFQDSQHPEKPIWWKGKIYTNIDRKE